MINVGIGISAAKDRIQAVKEALTEAKVNLHRERPGLAIVFSSAEYAHPVVAKTIISFLGNIALIGCSGLAIISHQGISKHGLVIMLLSIPKDIYFSSACVREISAKSASSKGEELGEKLLYGFKDIPRTLSLIFSDALIPDGYSIVLGLQQRLGQSFPLVGACASGLYFNQEVLSESACGILWGGKFNFGLGIKHGWKPLGKPRTVTKSSGHTVEKIDNAPAIKIYEEYFAKDISELKRDLKHISILYPIGVYLEGEEEYLLRNILSIEEDGSIVFQGDVPADSSIRLMIGTKESCLLATQQAIEEVKRGLHNISANLVLIFDSVSRYILLGREANQELEIIQKTLGKDTPLIGIYTYGEQAPLRAIGYLGKTYFHNQTITILGIAG